MMLAERVHAARCAPMAINGRSVVIGASIGGLVIDPEDQPLPTVREAHRIADRRMFIAKKAGGGIRFDDGPDNEPMTFSKRRRDTDRDDGAAARPTADPRLAEEWPTPEPPPTSA